MAVDRIWGDPSRRVLTPSAVVSIGCLEPVPGELFHVADGCGERARVPCDEEEQLKSSHVGRVSLFLILNT